MKYAILACCFLLTQIGVAQEQLTLLECVNIAIDNSLSLSQAELELKASEIDYRQSKMERLPNLNGSFNSGLNFGRSLDFTSYQFNNQATQSNSFGFNTGATLFSGGRIRENVHLQSLLNDRSETNIKKIKDDIAIMVAESFLQSITAREQIAVAETQVQLRKTDFERTQKLIEAGVSAGSLAVDMEAQLASANFQLQQAKNQYQLALLNLKQVMLVDFNKEMELVEPEIAFPSYDYLQSELNPAQVLAGALKTQGSIQLTNHDIAVAKSNKKIAESQRYPTLSIGGGVNSYHSDQAVEVIGTEQSVFQVPVEGIDLPNQNPYISFPNVNTLTNENYSIFNQFADNFTQNVGLNLSIPIFNRGQVEQQIAKADLNIKQAEIAQSVQEQQLAQTIQTAYMQADLAYRSFEASQLQVKSLEQAADFAKKRYDLGSASIYDYFTAQNNLANAKIQLTQAKYDYLYKIKVLEFYKDNQFELTK